jgi:hypothetical protein
MAGNGKRAGQLGGLAHETFSLFGSPADLVGPVALRPRLTSSLPLSAGEACRRGQYLPQPGSVCITCSADPGSVNQPFRGCRAIFAGQFLTGGVPARSVSWNRRWLHVRVGKLHNDRYLPCTPTWAH